MKLSPVSVPYKIGRKGISLVLTAAFLLYSGSAALAGVGGAVAAVALVALLVLALIAYEVAYYRRYEYDLAEDTFDIRSGVFSRRRREIPLRRIQNVDISRDVVQRLLGIAAVDFETAGGSETEAAIRYVSVAEAKRLQEEISRRKRGLTGDREGGTEPAEADRERELFALSDRELALVGLLSFDLRGPGFLLFLTSGSVPLLSSLLDAGERFLVLAIGGAAVVVLIVLISWTAGAAIAVSNYYGFSLSRTDDELRYERGLLRRYDGSIPFDKIQTLTIEDNPLKRAFGYSSLAIETAGHGPGQDDGGAESAIPLAERDRVVALANDVERFGTPEFERPPRRVRRRYAARYLIALGTVTAVLFGADYALAVPIPWWTAVSVLPLVPIAAHYKWKHRGYWLGDDHVVTRNGFWRRETKVVPYYRIQTVIETRTIFQRRWDLATVTVDTAGSLSIVDQAAAAVDIDADIAADLREELDERLRRAVVGRDAPAPGDGDVGGASDFEFGNVQSAG